MAAAVAQQPATAPPVTRYQGVDKQSSGYKLLAAMGWKEGEGLGASRQGIKEHIRVKKKFENWGVGAVEAAEKARDWTTGMLDFTRVLSTLSEITSQHARGRESGYDSSSEDEEEQRSDASDGELRRRRAATVAAGAAGEGGRVAGPQSGDAKKKRKKGRKAAGEEAEVPAGKKKRSADKAKKKKRGDKKEEGGGDQGATAKKGRAAARQAAAAEANSDSESGSNAGSDSDGEGAQPAVAAAAAQPKRVKFATHVGRFKRREAAKMVKNYSSTDLAAILGGAGAGASGAAAAAVDPALDVVFPTVEIQAERPADSSDISDSEVEEAGRATAPSGGGATSASGQLSGLACSSGGAQPVAPAPEDEGKWWAGYFGRAARGGAGGVGTSGRPSITVHGFREEDQENLYNMAQDGRTQGRVGLGRSSMPKKVAGTRWAGKKTKLGSDNEDEGEREGRDGGAGAGAPAPESHVGGPRDALPGEVHLGNGVVIVLPPSRRAELEPLLQQQQKGQPPPQQQQEEEEEGAQQAAVGGGGRKGSKHGAGGQAGGRQEGGAELAGLQWRKLVMQQLKASGKGRLSVSKLSKAIVKARGLGKGLRGRVEQLVAEAAGASSKLAIQDGVVRLA